MLVSIPGWGQTVERRGSGREGVRAPHHVSNGPFVAGWTKEVTQRHVYSATMRENVACEMPASPYPLLNARKEDSFLSTRSVFVSLMMNQPARRQSHFPTIRFTRGEYHPLPSRFTLLPLLITDREEKKIGLRYERSIYISSIERVERGRGRSGEKRERKREKSAMTVGGVRDRR